MKKLIVLFSFAALFFAGCDRFDDTVIWDKINDHEDRINKLELLCTKLNTNIGSLQAIVTALQNNDYVTSVAPIMENGKEVGYTITFSKSSPVTIYHGRDGKDGADGSNGANGQPGADGKDGHTPIIGVRQDADGIYYWTLDGDWLLDDNGNKIKAVGTDGKDGADGSNGANGQPGTDGKDGVTPQLKIEDGYWYISYDNGGSWTQLGKATGKDGKDGLDGRPGADGKEGDSFFKEVRQDEKNVYFVLADGTELVVPKHAPLSIRFKSEDLIVMSPNSTRSIGYTIESSSKNIKIEVISSSDIKAKVVAATTTTGRIQVTTSDKIDEYSKVVVLVSDGAQVIMHTLTFEEEAIEVSEKNNLVAPETGGKLTIYYMSNIPCEVIIPKEATWIHLVSTKALQEHEIVLSLDPNPDYYRSANVILSSKSGISLTYTIEQQGESGLADPTTVPDNEIWYRTNDNTEAPIQALTVQNANLVEHVYENNKWILRFDNPILELNFHLHGVTELYLPNCVEKIHYLLGINLTEFYVPQNLAYLNVSTFFGDNVRFYGNHVSEDGKSIIINGILYAFARTGEEDYIIPRGVEILPANLFSGTNFKKVRCPEGVKSIGFDCFSGPTLEEVYLPASLESLNSYAFHGCTNIKRFDGPSKFISNDRMFLYIENHLGYPKYMTQFACGSGHTEYIIPEGISSIGNYAFNNCETLQKLTFPTTLYGFVSGHSFEGCHNLEELCGANTSADRHCLIINNELRYFAGKGIKEYTVPDDVIYLGDRCFNNPEELETLRMSDNVKGKRPNDPYVYIFDRGSAVNLKELTLSANMEDLGMDPFEGMVNLEKVYCRAIFPPKMNFNGPLSMDTKFKNLTIYVPQQSLEAYKNNPDWYPYRKYLVGYEYTDLPESDIDYYYSTDYSRDGRVTTVQTATMGNGIDLVFMGDAFSDRQITDGTYRTAMDQGINALFSKEPYKSYKDMFNIYIVDVVSYTEGYGHGGQALSTFFGEGTYVGGNDELCMKYAQGVITDERMNEVSIVVMMNKDAYAGTCYMYYPEANADNYGCGPSVAYFPTSSDAATFNGLLLHEAGGHGFAKLDDEYAYEAYGQAPADYISQKQQQEKYGWWKNTDNTNDPAAVKWAHFLADERYLYDGLGVFEGASTYWTGMWRPTENSIMRYNDGVFNAPSREAIYYRIHKLAYGDSWEYDYEDFVEYDAINRTSSETAAIQRAKRNYVEQPLEPTTPPVIVGKTWREAMSEKE